MDPNVPTMQVIFVYISVLRIDAYMHACCYKAAAGTLMYVCLHTHTDRFAYAYISKCLCTFFAMHAYMPARGRSEDSDCHNRVHAVACVCMRKQCGSSVWMCDRVHESVRVRHLALDQHRFANWSRAWPAPTDITERSCSSCYADWFRLAGRNTDLIAYT